MDNMKNTDIQVWRGSAVFWSSLGAAAALLGFAFWDGLSEMVRIWDTQEAYGHGYMIPFIVLFLIWQSKDHLEKISFDGNWLGLAVILVGGAGYLLGTLSTIYVIINYAFVITCIGLAITLVGRGGIKYIGWPLFFLFFMIPLPVFLYRELSGALQLISSEIGVAVIRSFGISVFLEGNVIDLGVFKLQVVEACSGLNYLFPLMSLAFIAAYFFKVELWKRAIVFISSIPITVLMNSFRIGMIGVLVEYWGIEQAEGFLHDFEGWFIFMACMGILIIEMWLIVWLSKDSRPLMEVFGIDMPMDAPAEATVQERKVPGSFIVSVAVLALLAATSVSIEQREEIIPERSMLTGFPDSIGEWSGRRDSLEQKYLDLLKLDDYMISDYTNNSGEAINFYVAYYASQKAGESAHSPRSCIPGGGWLIKDLTTIEVKDVEIGGRSMRVNRLLIQKGDYRQLVYYWFDQRGRNVTNEYKVKWNLLWDSIMTNRSDGALVRLTTPLPPGEDISRADERLVNFARQIQPLLSDYIPD